MQAQTPYKIVFAGDGGVGKTALLRTIKGNTFERRYISTVGCEVHPIYMNDSGVTSYSFYDTAGQEKYSGNNQWREYFTGANAVVLVYDITSKISYKNLKAWYDKVRSVNPTVPVLIVGNKCDCLDSRRIDENPSFPLEEGLQFFEVSAKTGVRVEILLESIARACSNLA